MHSDSPDEPTTRTTAPDEVPGTEQGTETPLPAVPALVVVPLKSFSTAKGRLRGRLGDRDRSALAQDMGRHVIAVARQVAPTAVLSADAAVLSFAAQEGAIPLREPAGLNGTGGAHARLNSALDWAAEQAGLSGVTRLAILFGDLPDVTPDDVTALLAPRRDTIAVAPDEQGTGTNAIGLATPPPFPFAFGEGSFPRHLRIAQSAGLQVDIVRRPGLAHDVDTPADLPGPDQEPHTGSDRGRGNGAGDGSGRESRAGGDTGPGPDQSPVSPDIVSPTPGSRS